MKTKLREYLISLQQNLTRLREQRDVAEKLCYNVQCACLSKRIKDYEYIVNDITELLK